MRPLLAAAVTASLAGCTTAGYPGVEPVRRMPEGKCEAAAGQSFVGQGATAETGAAILRATGASTLRWLLPNAIVTMEYSAGRVNVGYAVRDIPAGQELYITKVTCG